MVNTTRIQTFSCTHAGGSPTALRLDFRTGPKWPFFCLFPCSSQGRVPGVLPTSQVSQARVVHPKTTAEATNLARTT